MIAHTVCAGVMILVEQLCSAGLIEVALGLVKSHTEVWIAIVYVV